MREVSWSAPDPRSFGVTELVKDLNAAQAAVKRIHFGGAHFRRDIVARVLQASFCGESFASLDDGSRWWRAGTPSRGNNAVSILANPRRPKNV